MTSSTWGAIQVRVASREVVARDVVHLELCPVADEQLPAWKPGAHIDVRLGSLRRQYSLCGDPGSRTKYEIAVLKQVGGRGGSACVHEDLQTGVHLEISRPKNHFRLVDSASYLFIAGGIGITPIKAMISECQRLGREWTLHYGGRSLESMAFADELASFGDRVRLVPEDSSGLLDLTTIVDSSDVETEIYCCGPEPLLIAIEQVVAQRPGRRLHLERFAPPAPAHLPNDLPIEVYCSESDEVVKVGAQQTVLEALVDAGIDVNFDCKEGTCGTCELDILEGIPDHRDAVLSGANRQESSAFFPCVSRAKSDRIVLDA